MGFTHKRGDGLFLLEKKVLNIYFVTFLKTLLLIKQWKGMIFMCMFWPNFHVILGMLKFFQSIPSWNL